MAVEIVHIDICGAFGFLLNQSKTWIILSYILVFLLFILQLLIDEWGEGSKAIIFIQLVFVLVGRIEQPRRWKSLDFERIRAH